MRLALGMLRPDAARSASTSATARWTRSAPPRRPGGTSGTSSRRRSPTPSSPCGRRCAAPRGCAGWTARRAAAGDGPRARPSSRWTTGRTDGPHPLAGQPATRRARVRRGARHRASWCSTSRPTRSTPRVWCGCAGWLADAAGARRRGAGLQPPPGRDGARRAPDHRAAPRPGARHARPGGGRPRAAVLRDGLRTGGRGDRPRGELERCTAPSPRQGARGGGAPHERRPERRGAQADPRPPPPGWPPWCSSWSIPAVCARVVAGRALELRRSPMALKVRPDADRHRVGRLPRAARRADVGRGAASRWASCSAGWSAGSSPTAPSARCSRCPPRRADARPSSPSRSAGRWRAGWRPRWSRCRRGSPSASAHPTPARWRRPGRCWW